jgi:hypothetical protein
MGGVGASELDGVPKVGKRSVDLVTFSEFASAIHADVSVRTRWGIVGQPLIEPINWGGLCRERLPIEASTEVISE